MPKFHFKYTPEEEAARKLRKKQKKEERRKRHRTEGADANSSTSKRRRREEEETWRKWASSDDEYLDDAKPGPSNRKTESDTLRAEVEEQRFRDKMFSALEDDERLDSIEAQFNDHAHIPNRWKRGGSNRMGIYTFEEPEDITDCRCTDPQYMDDEEYAEWIRTGMYRLKHAEEYAAQERKKVTYAARAAEEKARKAETARLEKAAEEERKRREREREMRQWRSARASYDQRWKELFSGVGYHQVAIGRLNFVDVPWPVFKAYQTPHPPDHTSVCLEDLTEDAITRFLLLAHTPSDQGSATEARQRKEKLKEAMLRFHPDKFEGRCMQWIDEGDQSLVKEGIGQVVRVLSSLLGQ